MFQKLSYLLVGVRPVKAQEKVGGLTVQQEISCPEWDGKPLESTAKVKRDPQVLGVSICKDVLQEKEISSEQNLAKAAQHSPDWMRARACRPSINKHQRRAKRLQGFHTAISQQ